MMKADIIGRLVFFGVLLGFATGYLAKWLFDLSTWQHLTVSGVSALLFVGIGRRILARKQQTVP